MHRKTIAFMAAALLLVAPSALAQDYKLGKLMISKPWARVTLPDKPGAGYMQIHNMADGADKIVSASSKAADRVELHTHIMDKGVMKMRKVEAIGIQAKGLTELKPGGLHLMFFGINKQLKMGDKIPVTVNFEKAGSLGIEMDIKMKEGGGEKSMDHKMSD